MDQSAHSQHPQHHSLDPTGLTESCPYCGQDITHDEFLEIQARISKEEKDRFDKEFEKREKQLQAKHLGETSELRKIIVANEENLKTQLNAQRESHAKDLATQAEQARKNEREKLKVEYAEKDAKQARILAELESEKKKLAEVKLNFEKEAQIKLDHQRTVLEKDTQDKIAELKADEAKKTHKLTEQVDDLKRKLERKSNEELGDGAEVDLYADLKKAFPDDVITRVKNGEAGADIKHEVHVEGRFCGKIVYDSKNRTSWRSSYVEQLRNDQLAEDADHAILATRKFPKDTRELSEVNSILLVNPARATVLAKVLRESIIRLSNLTLSEQGKKDKRSKLYEFITSANCENLFQRAEDEITNLRELDVTEKKQQESIRRKRAKFVSEIEKAMLGNLKDELNTILGV